MVVRMVASGKCYCLIPPVTKMTLPPRSGTSFLGSNFALGILDGLILFRFKAFRLSEPATGCLCMKQARGDDRGKLMSPLYLIPATAKELRPSGTLSLSAQSFGRRGKGSCPLGLRRQLFLPVPNQQPSDSQSSPN